MRVSETEITLRVTTKPVMPLRDSITPVMITKALRKAANALSVTKKLAMPLRDMKSSAMIVKPSKKSPTSLRDSKAPEMIAMPLGKMAVT